MEKPKLENWLSGFMFAIIFTTSNAWSAQDEKNSPGFAWKDGAEIYAKICAYCHEAHVGPQIRNRDLPAAYIRAIVRNGNRPCRSFVLQK